MNQGYRHEIKFLISAADARLLKMRLPHIMERDPYAGPTGQYTIRSLYFDDFSHRAYSEKIDGINIRGKYRIRYYNYDTSIMKLEKKEKLGNLTKKTAQTISISQALKLQYLRHMDAPETTLLRELEDKLHREGFRPMVLVDYDRTPFLCRDGNTRITLDENLRTRPFCADLLASHHAMTAITERNQVVLEVKFDDFLPGYLADALADIPKANLAISKFALCMNLM